MLPVAFVFMFFVFGSSTVDFDDSRPISGHLFPLAAGHPVVWPMGSSEAMVEARIHIQSSAGPGGGGGGGHRRFSARGQRPSLLHSAQKHSPSVRRRKNPSENVRRLELDKPKKQHAGTRTPPKHPETRPAALAAHVIRGTVDRKILQTESVCGTPPQVPEPWQAVCDNETAKPVRSKASLVLGFVQGSASRLISSVVRYPFTPPLATAHVHPCAVSTPQRRSAVTPTPPAAQPLKNRAPDLREAQLLSRFIKRTDGGSSNRSNLLTPLQCGRTDGDSSSRSKLLTPLVPSLAQCGPRTDGDSSSRSNLLTPLQCERTDGDSSSRSNLHGAGPLRFLCVNLLPCSRAPKQATDLNCGIAKGARYI